MNKKSIIAIVVILVVVVGGILVLAQKSDDKKDTTTPAATDSSTADTTSSTSADSDTAATADQTAEAPASTDAMAAAIVISYNGSSFSPSKVTVKAGERVTVKNTSSDEVQFNSDPHPDHTDNKELNIGSIDGGKSATITVKNKGTWGYHNHLDDTQTGTIVIQ